MDFPFFAHRTGNLSRFFSAVFILALVLPAFADPFPPTWSGGAGTAIHHAPVAWPNEPANPLNCGASCGDWKAYTRFQQSMNDPRTNDPSNGGTSPQAYVNVASSCSDKAQPSIYYYLHQGATPADDVLMFRWRVESAAHNYATGPSAGNYGASNPWSSALWTVLFDVNGSGYRSLAAHLDGSSGSPAKPIDMLVGIWGDTPSHSLDYVNDPKVHLLGHNPTAFIGPTGKILNFQSALSPVETWPNGSAETVWDYGTTRARKVSQNSCTEFFIDYQIPIAMLDASALGGPKITRSTPISMLFCTANSLNNPFQKDCAVNKAWGADTAKAAPFGDYLSFNQTEPYSQPIISKVTAEAPSSCPGTYGLQATVQDTLALQSGVVTTSVQAVDFFYWFDADGDGTANDAGSAWTRITPTATRETGSLNQWRAQWDASSLPKGKYLVGAQAVDDNTKLDDNMVATGINNRTFSYISGDAANKIFINGAWATGQAASFPTHAVAQTPDATENWYGNPDVTGQQLALVGTAINACGVAPEISLALDKPNAAAGDSLQFTISLQNPATNANAVSVSSLSLNLPGGFSYQAGTSTGTGGLGNNDPSINSGVLTWSYGSPVSLAPGASITMTLAVTATNTAGSYNTTASAVSSFGGLTSSPVAVAVDAARVSLGLTPASYAITADNTTNLLIRMDYSNDASIDLGNAGLSVTLPNGLTFVGCTQSCAQNAGQLSWNLGTLNGGETGAVEFTVRVPTSWDSSSITFTGSLSAVAPDASPVSKTATTKVAVTGYSLPGMAAMTLTKTASATRIAPSGTVTYTLSYTNTGTATANGVVITDTLPAGVTYTSLTGGGTHSAGVVTWNIGSVAQGASGSVTVTATAAASPFTYPNPTSNVASIDWTGGSAVAAQAQVGISGDYCSAVFYFRQGANNNLATIRPASQAASTNSAAYTTTLSNISDNTFESYSTEVNQVVFEQLAGLGSALDISNQTLTINYYLSAAQGGGRSQVILRNHTQNTTIATSSELNISTGTGSWYSFTATIPPGTSIGANDKLRWYFQFRASGGKDITFHYDSTNINSRSSFCTTTGPAVLSLTGSVSQTSIVEGTTPTLTYTLNYANTGGTSATNVALTGNLPTGFTGCEYSTNNSTWNSCSGAGSHTFSTIASLAAGAGGTVYIRGLTPTGTQAGNSLTANPSIQSTQTTSSSAAITTQVVAAAGATASPQLALQLSANKSTAIPGDTVVYTLSATNLGNASATNVVITNTLPVNSFLSYTSCTGGCTHNANTLSWNAGTFTAGQTKTYTYTMQVGSTGLAAGVQVINDDASASGDGALSALSNTHSLSISGNPLLTASMTATPNTGLKPGDTITYSASIQNLGNATATGVSVNNPIPTYTQFKGSLNASGGTATFDTVNNRVVISGIDLAANASLSYSFQVTLSNLDSGLTPIVNTATASADNAGQISYSASANATATPTLELSQTLGGSAAFPAASLTANANGAVIFVDNTSAFQLNQLISINGQVRQILAIAARSLTLDAAVTGTAGDALVSALTLSLNLRNAGDASALNVSLNELLPVGLGFHSAANSPSAPPQGSSGSLSWSIGTLEPGASATRSVVVFPGATGSYTVSGVATASNATSAQADLAVVIGGISVAKSTSTPLVAAGDLARYTITLTNSLASPVANVSLRDWLPAGFSYAGNGTVNGTPTTPVFEPADVGNQQPAWQNLTVPANSSLEISFDALVNLDAGASAYQNEVEVSLPAGVGLVAFDPIRTTAEDVTVLAANSGVIRGYAFYRSSGNSPTFDVTSDAPIAAARVEIYQAGADCTNLYDPGCFITYTDSNGYFEVVVPAQDWYINLPSGGAIDSNWQQTLGTNNQRVTVPSQMAVWDYNGYSLVNSSSSSLASSALASSSSTPSSAGLSSSDMSSSVSSASESSAVAVPASSSAVASSEPVASSLASSSNPISSISASSSIAPSSLTASSSAAPSSVPASSIAPSSMAPSSTATSSATPSSVALSSAAPSSVAPSSTATSSATLSSAVTSSAAPASSASSVAVSEPASSSQAASSQPLSSLAASSSSSTSSQASIVLALVDENNRNYTGETLLRGQSKAFKVLGGQGAIQLSASVLRGGKLSLAESTVGEFFAAQGATLVPLANGNYRFSSTRAGVFAVSFRDAIGQEVTATFEVHPRIAFTSTYQLGTQGVALLVSVILDDEPVNYPVVVPFRLENEALMDLPASRHFVIEAGNRSQISMTPMANGGEVKLVLQEDGLENATLGGLVEHRVQLVAPAAIPLKLTIASEQGGIAKTLLMRSDGLVTLTSSLRGDGYSYDWSGSAPELGIGAATSDTVTLNPAALDGRYPVQLRVSERSAPNRSLAAELNLRVVGAVPTSFTDFLAGAEELDAHRLPICIEGGMNRVLACATEQHAIYMETLDKYNLKLGRTSDYASWRDTEFALSVEQTDIVDSTGKPAANQVDREYNHLGYRVDFELAGLEQPGQSVPVVIPLKPGLAITANSVWRKYVDGLGWRNFVENERNSLASSARLADGLCPWAGANEWRPGLQPGDDCVRLIIEDGGPNDGDGRADMVVRDPSTLAIRAEEREVTTLGKGAGGGALRLLDLLLLISLLVAANTAARYHRNPRK